MPPFNINLPPWKSGFQPEDTGAMIPPPANPYAQYAPPPPPDFTPAPPAPAPIEETQPEFTYPARDALLEYAKGVPQQEKPGVLQRIASGAAGASAGWFQGGGAGYKTGQDVLMTPYRQAVEKWRIGLQPLETAARVEAATGGLGVRQGQLDLQRQKWAEGLAFQKQKQAALEAWRASKQKSASYEGNWKFQDFIDPKGTTHNLAFNNKSKQWIEYTDQGEIPSAGPGTGWNEYTSQVRSYTTPDETIGMYDPMRTLRQAPTTPTATAPPAMMETNVKVAPPIPQLVVSGTGEVTGGVGRGGKPVSIQPIPGAEMRKSPKSEAQLTKEDTIQNMEVNVNRLSELYPLVEKQIGPIKGQLMSFGAKYAPKELLPQLQKVGINITPELQEFVQIADDLSAEKVKERSGVAFKDWELRWIQNSAPTYTTSNFGSALKRYRQGIRIMMENRNMTPKQFENAISTETTKQEQTTPKRWKKFSNGKTFIEDSPDRWRAIESSDVLDPKQELK